jgi:hypothetical protein
MNKVLFAFTLLLLFISTLPLFFLITEPVAIADKNAGNLLEVPETYASAENNDAQWGSKGMTLPRNDRIPDTQKD